MNIVQPIRDLDILEAIQQHLKETNARNYMLFMVGIYTGLRISDILPLKVKDVTGTHISMRERKTRKQKLIPINTILQKELKVYIDGLDEEDYLFQSRQKNSKGIRKRPIDASMAYKMLSGAAKKFGLKEIGTHTLRKTFGYHFYKKTKNLALLMSIFNHHDESITLRYIGINQDSIDKAMSSFKY